MPLLKRLRVAAAQVEVTPGTAVTNTATHGAFNAYDVEIQGAIDVEQREAQGSFNYLSGIPGARSGTLSFKTDIAWDGTATEPTWLVTLMQGCGWVLSTNTLYPASETPGSNVKTLSVSVFENGLEKKLAGAVGNFNVVCPNGRAAFIEWEYQGVWQAVTDQTLIAPTYPTDTILRYASATTTYDSVALCVQQISFNSGNTIHMRECASTAAGYDYGIITSRYPTATADPESELVATRDDYGDWLAGSEAELSVTLDGPSTSTLEIEAPKAQIWNVQEGDRDMLQIDTIEWRCNKNSTTADQELAFKFTPTA